MAYKNEINDDAADTVCCESIHNQEEYNTSENETNEEEITESERACEGDDMEVEYI
jgi:hypothetical protein